VFGRVLCGIDAIAQHRIDPTRLRIQVVARMRERHHTPLAEHDVEVEFLRQLLVLLHRKVIQPRTLGVEVV
jgi:hypothetical protein